MNRLSRRLPRLVFCLAACTWAVLGRAQVAPLDALASWVGGRWVAELATADGRKFTLARTYEWSFDRRVLVGKTWAGPEVKSQQTRETFFWWNAQAQRIEFQDFIDEGGYGVGFVEQRDGAWFMQARMVGTLKHPPWRAWLTQDQDGRRQTMRVQAEQDGKWVDYGVFVYERRPG